MLPPPKTSKMSAEAPVFQPRPKMEDEDPAVAASAASAPNPSVTTGEGGQIHGGAKEIDSDTREKLNAAVAASRVTRPLPGSRRPAAAANMVPQAATTVKTGEEKENRRRLIVVLSQVGTLPCSVGCCAAGCMRSGAETVSRSRRAPIPSPLSADR